MSTPQRDNADPNTIDYIKLFFEDFPGSMRTKAADRLRITQRSLSNLREQRLRFERVSERNSICRATREVEDTRGSRNSDCRAGSAAV